MGMEYSAYIGYAVVLFLAMYGCAQGIRWLCLRLTRCPGCAVCCRVAVPRSGAAVAPLMRCLQSQTVWGDPAGCRYTLVVLPALSEEEQAQLAILRREAPAVIPVTAEGLYDMLLCMTAEERNKTEDTGKE